MNTTETYGGIGSGATGASTATSIPESSPTTGRGMTTGTYDLSSSGTGTNPVVIDPSLSTTAKPKTISGVGIHAQQYRGREGEYGLGTTTTVSSSGTPGGIGHHVPHHHHHGHKHAPADISTGLRQFVVPCIIIPLILF